MPTLSIGGNTEEVTLYCPENSDQGQSRATKLRSTQCLPQIASGNDSDFHTGKSISP